MNFERLRELILERAIQGKLVPQLESEPGVAKITARPKEPPFDIPEKWKWAQLKNVGKIVGGGTPKTNIAENWENGQILWFTPSDLGKVRGLYAETSARKITLTGLQSSAATMMPKDTVLFSSRAPIGHIALAPADCCTNQGCKSFVANSSYILPLWAYWVLANRKDDIISRASGTTFKEISLKGMSETWIPVPPIQEQHRIISKIQKLLRFVDSAEMAFRDLQLLSGVLHRRVLHLAIQGRLVPQLESELSVGQIGEVLQDVPFKIPDKWKWVQLKSVGKVVGGGTPKTNIAEYWYDGSILWFTPVDLGKVKGIHAEDSERKITKLGLENSSATLIPANTVLYSSRAPIGYIALAKSECCTNQGCKSFVPNEAYITPIWAYWALRARTPDVISRSSGTTFKEISGRKMSETWIPLPSIREQKKNIG